jgi:hypothetical protein
MICCTEKYPEGFRRCARSRGVTGDQKGALALPGVTGIDENLAAEVRTPARKFHGLATSLGEKRGEMERSSRAICRRRGDDDPQV